MFFPFLIEDYLASTWTKKQYDEEREGGNQVVVSNFTSFSI